MATNGVRVSGCLHKIQTANGSCTGRGMTKVSARKATFPTLEPEAANAPATNTNVKRLPAIVSVQTKTENPNRMTVAVPRRHSMPTATTCRMPRPIGPIATTACITGRNAGE